MPCVHILFILVLLLLLTVDSQCANILSVFYMDVSIIITKGFFLDCIEEL